MCQWNTACDSEHDIIELYREMFQIGSTLLVISQLVVAGLVYVVFLALPLGT